MVSKLPLTQPSPARGEGTDFAADLSLSRRREREIAHLALFTPSPLAGEGRGEGESPSRLILER